MLVSRETIFRKSFFSSGRKLPLDQVFIFSSGKRLVELLVRSGGWPFELRSRLLLCFPMQLYLVFTLLVVAADPTVYRSLSMVLLWQRIDVLQLMFP